MYIRFGFIYLDIIFWTEKLLDGQLRGYWHLFMTWARINEIEEDAELIEEESEMVES